MQTELPIELSGFHPCTCPCEACQDELDGAGSQPITLIPAWFLQQHAPEFLAHLQSLGMRERQ